MQNMLVPSHLTLLDPNHLSLKRYLCWNWLAVISRNFEGLLAGSFSYIVSCLIWQDKHNLGDIIQMYHQAKARQLSTQSDASSLVYPEFILPYLVHALAHHSCPDIDECKDVKAFEPIYWYICFHMYIFFSLKCNFWYFSYEKSFTRKGEKYV